MPHFVLSHGPGGPIIQLYVAISLPRLKFLQNGNQVVPPPFMARGLVDTGASHTCVDPSIVSSLGLTPKRIAHQITPSTGTTPHRAFTYDVSIHVPGNSASQILLSRPAIEVTGSELSHQGFEVLIGRDLLADGLFIYDGRSGQFTLSF